MKIDSIEIYHVRMPLLEPWRTAYGSDAAIESLLVRMRSNGAEGWGESCPLAMPCYSAEYASGVFNTLKHCLAPRLLGSEITSGTALQERLSIFKGNPFAKAALDTAWWDLYAQAQGKPLYRLLGGQSASISAGADFGIRDSINELTALVSEALASGAPRVKLKFAPHWGVEVLEAVRACAPSARLHIDCNSGYTLRDLPLLHSLDRFGLEMIEQPLQHDDLADHATLARTITTPICLDESIQSLHTVEQAISLRACQWVNIKPGRVGGLTVALQILALCEAAGIKCWVGGMLESAVGAMHCAALATLPHFSYPADLFPTSRFYVEDLSEPDVRFSSPWRFTLPEGAGIGASPNPRRLKEWTLQHASFSI